jgi:hypothetical protein
LGRRPITQALQNPVVVIAISELDECGPPFLEIPEAADPEELFFEGAKEALDATIAFGLAHEGR